MIIKLAINGANGKMGKEILKILQQDTNTEVVELFDHSNVATHVNTHNIDVIIDFSSEGGLTNLLQVSNCKIISGTTGISESVFKSMKEYGSTKNGIIWGSNVSFGVNLMFAMAKKLGSILGEEYDAEIYERHHNLKKDSPSGTALTIGKKIAQGRNTEFIQRNNSIQSERKKGEIGFAVERGGKTVGYHNAAFISNDERIWLGHEAFDRSIFAKGAIKLAKLAHIQHIQGFHEACDVILESL